MTTHRDKFGHTNEFGQPIGAPLEFTGPWPAPTRVDLKGRYCTLRRAKAHHAEGLLKAFDHDPERRNWTYMPTSPSADPEEFKTWFLDTCLGDEFQFYTCFNTADEPVGIGSFLRINPAVGSVEVGWISMSPLMQRSRISTEMMYLMMAHVFDDLGYRRYEWKCDSCNGPSKAAAERLGFTFEGIFRQCVHYKGRNRDTAWLSILDHEWPAQKARFQAWLDPKNFDADGQQKRRLQG